VPIGEEEMKFALKNLFLVLAILLCLIQNATAEEKITGAFGMKLGDIFDPASAIGTGSLTDGTPMYRFNQKKGFRSFSRYYVLITPKTNKIVSIWGIGDIENYPLCKKEQQLIMAILQDKYGKPEKKDLFSRLYDVKMISQDDRYIMTKCTGFSDVTIEIRYGDNKLENLAENERIELESKKLDSSGL